MPPNFTPYIDLTPYDVTAESAYLGAIELAQLTLPEFQLRQGTVEDSVFQAMAYMSMLNVAAINRLPSRLMVGIARLLGVEPNEGSRAVLQLAINLYPSEAPITLPSRTVFTYSQTFDGQKFDYAFETVQDETIYATISDQTATSTTSLAIGTGSKTFTTQSGLDWVAGMRVRATSVANSANYMEGTITSYSSTTLVLNIDKTGGSGTIANWDLLTMPNVITVYSQRVGIHPTPSEGDPVVLQSVNSSVEEVMVATSVQADPDLYFSAGSNPETDLEYLARCTSAIRALNSTICTAEQLKNYILTNYTDVSKCKVYDLMTSATRLLDANGQQTQTTTQYGNMYVMVYGIESNLSTARKNEIDADVTALSVAGMAITVTDPDLLEITGLTINFSYSSQYEEADIEQEVKDTVAHYLSPAGFDTSKEAVFIGSIAAILNSIEGVEYVQLIDFNVTGMDSVNEYYEDAQLNLWFRKAGMMPYIDPANITVVGTAV